MALSAETNYKIVRLLGWPLNTLTPNSVLYSKIISDRLTAIPVDAEIIVTDMLDRIEALDLDLKTALSQAGLKRIDDIEFFGAKDGDKLHELRKERRKLILELGEMTDIPVSPASGRMGNVYI